jgi:hypothetical protein
VEVQAEESRHEKEVKKLKKAKAMPAMGGMMMDKPKPVSIHIHAEGEHMDAAHKDLARQLKPLGFSMKKPKMGMKKKSIANALSS